MKMKGPPTRLRIERIVRSLSQAEAGALAGLNQQQFSLIERGLAKPDAEKAAALEKAFGIPIDELMAIVAEDSNAA